MTRDAHAMDSDLVGRLEVDNISKVYRTSTGTVHALDHVALSIEAGQFVCSTLLDIIAGLTKADEGQVLADGQLVEGSGIWRPNSATGRRCCCLRRAVCSSICGRRWRMARYWRAAS